MLYTTNLQSSHCMQGVYDKYRRHTVCKVYSCYTVRNVYVIAWIVFKVTVVCTYWLFGDVTTSLIRGVLLVADCLVTLLRHLSVECCLSSTVWWRCYIVFFWNTALDCLMKLIRHFFSWNTACPGLFGDVTTSFIGGVLLVIDWVFM